MHHYSDEQLIDIANKYMNDLMEASTQRNYQGHIQNFSQRLKQLLDEDRFNVVVEQYQKEKGVFKDRNFVASFRRPNSFAVIWRQTFTQIKGDYIAELVLIAESENIVIDHVMVF